MDFMQMIQMMKNGGNPQQMIMSMLQNTKNPMAQNLYNMAQNNNGQGIEQIARNMCAVKGKDFDKEFSAFRKQFGI